MYDVLMAQGLNEVVLSPGSRNAPLLIAASTRQDLKTHIIADERTAAFIALGIAVASQRPVMIACTSGTALYNYAPAVAEAYYQHVPIIVVSADRPARWIDQDDSQTLRQPGALANIVKRSFNITLGEGETVATKGNLFNNEREWFVNRTVNEAWIAATSGIPGPVHINIQLDNPLGQLGEYCPSSTRTIELIKNPNSLPPHIIAKLADRLIGKKVLVTAGFMSPDHQLNKALNEFLKLPNVAICAEPISNLHLPEDCFIIDSLLCKGHHQDLSHLRPDIVISIGGSLVSRMLKEFLREYQPNEHWTLSDTDYGVDMFQALTTHIECSASHFFHLMAQKMNSRSNPEYCNIWRREREEANNRCKNIIKESTWSELKAFDRIFTSLPVEYNLFLSNGTPVRYGALLLKKLPHSCYSNRGVSGIDGTSATALGIAMTYKTPTLLITGDLSFSYAPQIMGLKEVPKNFKIIVINNSGGGIFRFIPTTRDLEQREQYFCADTPMPLNKLCDSFDWDYYHADNEKDLEDNLPDFFAAEKPSLLEIKVEPEISSKTLINLLS